MAKNLSALTSAGFTYSTLKNSIKLVVEFFHWVDMILLKYVNIKIIDVFAHWGKQPHIM